MKKIHIIGGGTVFHIRPHLALSAVAYGNTAKIIASECEKKFDKQVYEIIVHLTKMASSGHSNIETNNDVELLINEICKDSQSSILFLPVALCDFEANIEEKSCISHSGKLQPRLISRAQDYKLVLTKADKLISKVKKLRPNIILIGFKTTSNVTKEETIALANNLLTKAECDVVFSNDIYKRQNLILSKEYISPLFEDREVALYQLVAFVAKLS